MSRYDFARVVVGIALGLGLASLPFLQYGARTHSHAPHTAHDHVPHETHDHAHHD
ncbi:MAG: hypothetical protein ABIR79_07380 [Candidatus Binatia bacterium]